MRQFKPPTTIEDTMSMVGDLCKGITISFIWLTLLTCVTIYHIAYQFS